MDDILKQIISFVPLITELIPVKRKKINGILASIKTESANISREVFDISSISNVKSLYRKNFQHL